ncbi:MAG: exodeoxyribonuclease VII large subunit, partial [Lachnospiraceae bacterium]|nr:exodeoxyribonuclease VII large subunit [Lachnospiraceae bacterium]
MRRDVYTVGQLNAYIKNMFMQDYLLQAVFVRGEVSNCKYHSSGHIYFTLKDSKGAVNCVMFAGNRSGLSFRLAEGQQVVVGGNVDVYERDGKYQIYAKQIVLDGAGLLYEKYERLKRELEEEGMFAQEYKQSIPKYIKTLGVVTADTGAAVRDIIQVAKRRNPYVQI